MDKLLTQVDYEAYFCRHVSGLKPKRGESYGLCPFHSDKKPSFRVNLAKGVWTCPVCNIGGDIFSFHMKRYGVSFKDAKRAIADEQNITIDRPKLVKTYQYHDADGKVIYEKQRYESSEGKTFKFKSSGGNNRGSEQVIYNLPHVMRSKCVIITEGEKCADKVIEMGLCGTTLDSGANSKWLPKFSDLLRGKNIILLPDNDAPGKEYMLRMAENLDKCKIIELPRLKQKGDIADWDGTKDELLALIKETPLWDPARSYVLVKSLVSKVYNEMLFTDPASRGVLTGIKALDDMGGCFRRQDLIVIGGRPSMGKTALGLSIMRNMAKSGEPVLIFSQEMAKEQLVERLLCMESGASMHEIIRRKNMEDNTKLIISAAGQIYDLPIWIDESGGLEVEVLELRLKKAIADHGIKCVFIDYLQLMNSSMKNPENRAAYIGHISRNLKRIAKENDIPVVLLAQVNRDCEKRPNKRPNKSDLKDSGEIEQDADVIILLYRDEEYNPSLENSGKAEAIFAKYRNGRTGIVHLAFIKHSMRFADLGIQ